MIQVGDKVRIVDCRQGGTYGANENAHFNSTYQDYADYSSSYEVVDTSHDYIYIKTHDRDSFACYRWRVEKASDLEEAEEL